jgi:hypothetical protein
LIYNNATKSFLISILFFYNKMIESVYETLPAPYAAQAISECRDRGARIAIATAETCPDFNTHEQQRFLDSIGILPEDMRFCDSCGYYGDDEKLCVSSGLCQSRTNNYKDSPPYNQDDTICTGVSQPNGTNVNNFGSIKRPMIQEIIKGANDASKVIFFDDQLVNRQMADSMHSIKTQSASDNCDGKSCDEGTGLTKKNFEDGMAKVDGNPEICIFDIDNTLTMGRNISIEQVEYKQLLSILIILIILAIIALAVR